MLIDPLAVDDLSPLGAVLADPSIVKIFHAADYDIRCLRRDYGFVVNGLFDTMVSAQQGTPKLTRNKASPISSV